MPQDCQRSPLLPCAVPQPSPVLLSLRPPPPLSRPSPLDIASPRDSISIDNPLLVPFLRLFLEAKTMTQLAIASMSLATIAFSSLLLSLERWPWGTPIQRFLRKHNPKKSKTDIQKMQSQLANRIVSVVHNIIQIPFALVLLSDPEINGNHLRGWTDYSTVCLAISAGYFAVDVMICSLHFKDEGPLFLFHAVASLSLYCYGAISGFLHYYGAAFLMWEVSTPFVHARWLMKSLNKFDGTIYVVNGLIMIFTFFLFRCVYGFYLSYDFITVSAVELHRSKPEGIPFIVLWLCRGLNVGLNGLNVFWMTKMIQRVSAFLKQKEA